MPTIAARWTRKPPPGTDLDRTHPLCPDHCWPFLSPQGTAQALWRSIPLSAPSTRGDIYANLSKMVSGRKYGLSVRHGAAADVMRFTATGELERVVPLSGGWTVLACYRKTDATLRASAAFGASGTTAGTECTMFIPYSDGNVFFDYGGTVAGTTRLSASGLTFGDDLWVFSTGIRGMEIWQNGLLRASNSANPTRTAAPTNSWNFSPFVTFGDLADLALMMTWRRQVPRASIQALSVNPWQVYQPPTVMAVSAVSPTIGSAFPALTLAP